MPTLGHINNYYPRMYDILEAQQRPEELAEIIARFNDVQNPQATVENIVSSQNGYSDYMDDMVGKASAPSAQARKEQLLTGDGYDEALVNAGFVFKDSSQVLEHYVISMVKRAEYQKVFGGHRRVENLDVINDVKEGELKVMLNVEGQRAFTNLARAGGFELTKRTDQDIEKAIQQGYLKLRSKNNDYWAEWYSPTFKENQALEQIESAQGGLARQEAQKIIDAYMGRTGLDLDPKLRKAMSYATVSYTHLTLPTIYSV